MVRLFTLIFLLATFTVQAQIGKTETEDYKAGFEQKADIDEVSDYMLDYQLPIQVSKHRLHTRTIRILSRIERE